MARRMAIRAWALALICITGSIGLLLPASGAESWVKNDLGTPADERLQLSGVAAGDGDRDGSPEVYFTAMQPGGIFQYTYDDSAGKWAIENIAGPGFSAGAIVLGDGDDSGDREIYVTGMNREPPRMRAAVYQFFYTVKGWERVLVGSTGSAGNDIAIGDGNNDSRTELFTADGDGHIYQYSRSGNSWNTLDIGNSTASSNQPGNPMESVAVGDGDNDGFPEVYGSSADGSVYRFEATGFGWSMTVVSQGEFTKLGSDMSGIVVGDADGDGKNEVFGASFANASIYMFKFDGTASSWTRTKLVSLGSGVRAMGLAIGDGNTDGKAELYAGTNNNQVYKIFLDASTGNWYSSSVGSGNGPMNDVCVSSATGDAAQNEVYAACLDGHGYQFVVDRTPPANPTVSSDTHPSPGTWYSANIVHVLWQDTGKDVSGIDGYSYSWDNLPASVPDDRKEVEESVHDATSTALSPGKWYFHIRARDNALNWNASATHFGPICIGTAPDITPPQISNLQVSGITDKLAVMSWSTNEPADGLVEYGKDTAYGQKAADAAFVLEHSIRLTDLLPSTTYHFKVASRDTSGNGPAESGDLSFTTLAAPDTTPPAISNVRVTGVTDRVAVVSWETDEPGDSAVDYGPGASYGQSAVDGTFVRSHELTLTGLNASTVYHFRVRSSDATGNGPAASGDLTFTTLSQPDKTAPAITNVRAEQVTADKAIILWDTDEVADSFIEYGTTVSYGQSSADRTFTLGHSLLLQGLSSDTAYHFRALSADSSGNTGRGSDLTFRTLKTPSAPDLTPPVISGVLVAGISDIRAVVLWQTDELADSDVEYGTGTGYGLRTGEPSDTLAHSIVLSGLRPSTEYHFRVSSTDVFGNGPSVGADVKFTTAGNPDTLAPAIQTVRVTNITSTGATITWTTNEPADSAVDYGNGTGYGHRQLSRQYVLSHSLVLSNLQPGKVYHFRACSTDPAGNAAVPSEDRAFTTLKSSGTATTTGEPFPWIWIGLAVILVAGLTGGFSAYRRYARGRARPEFGAQAPAALAAGPPAEEMETLEMDSPMPETGPAIPAAAQTYFAPAPTAPSQPVPLRHIRCPKCRARIPLYGEGPQEIVCPACGASGEYRQKTSAQPPVAPAPAPMAAPRAGRGAPPPAVSAAAAQGPGAPVRMTRCSACGSTVPIYTNALPVRITCPGCGRTGIFQGPRGA